MREPTHEPAPVSSPAPFAGPMLLIVTAVVACSLYANLALLVKNSAQYRFFPPFQRGYNGNRTDHFGGEYYHIATALASGRGYSDPFGFETGPTAWMPPVLTWVLAALQWLAGGDKEVLRALLILLQNLSLIGNGLLVVALARRTTPLTLPSPPTNGGEGRVRGGQVGLATAVFLAGLVFYFELSFQFTHDCWLVLGVVDLLIAGLVWGRPLAFGWWRAAGWGAFGGFCALTSPIVGFAWGILTLAIGWRRPQWTRLAVAVVAAGLMVTPWVVRNYLMFGRFIPVKSNLAYELYQSQCLQPGGVLRDPIFATHPNTGNNREAQEYQQLGEMAFLDRKHELFRQAVQADPASFIKYMANRGLAATVVYIPYTPYDEARRPWRVWLTRLVYPLPFLGLLLLLATTPWRPLSPAQWVVIGVYLCYLLPYVVVSYYERYKFPLVGAEIALTVWGLGRVKQMWLSHRTRVPAEARNDKSVSRQPAKPRAALSLPFPCPACGRKLRVRLGEASSAGKKVKCPLCDNKVLVPEAPPVKQKITNISIRIRAEPGDAL